MDTEFNKGLEDNPWAATATPAEVDIMKRKPDSPPLEHIPDTMEMFDPWADPARAQLPDFSFSRNEQQIPINNNLEEELHDVESKKSEIADFPSGVFYIRSVLSHKVRYHLAIKSPFRHERSFKAHSSYAMVWQVLDVREGSKKADTPVVLWTKKQDGTQSQNQLWLYHDGYIVNVHSRLVLDIRGSLKPEDLDAARIIQYNRKNREDAHNQLFAYDEGRIYCQAKPHLVLDVADKSSDDGVYIIITERDDDRVSQLWSFEEVQAAVDKDKILGSSKSHWWK
ncbi:hypothetical protein NQZ79_g3291 [Umbelopsis isabellina]|nr:hypothetical protein NQZ79_g3291 [Umbelopsis isabellina]